RSSWRRAFAVGAVAIAAPAVLFILMRGRAAPAASLPEDLQSSHAPAPLPEKRVPNLTLTVNAKPSNATIFLDDTPLSGNPAVVTNLPFDQLTHRLRAEAPGFSTMREHVVFDSAAVSVDLVLDKESRPKAVTTSQSKAGTSPKPDSSGPRDTGAANEPTTSEDTHTKLVPLGSGQRDANPRKVHDIDRDP